SSDLDISKLQMSPMFSRIAETKNFLGRNTAIIDGIPKTIVVLRLTNPLLYNGNRTIRLVVPTINKEYAVAKAGDTPKKYTNTGTVSIEPPPPIKPKDNPIAIDAIYPIISINCSVANINLKMQKSDF